MIMPNNDNESEDSDLCDPTEVYETSKEQLLKFYNAIGGTVETTEHCSCIANMYTESADTFLEHLLEFDFAKLELENVDEEYGFEQLRDILHCLVSIGTQTVRSWLAAKDIEFLEEKFFKENDGK